MYPVRTRKACSVPGRSLMPSSMLTLAGSTPGSVIQAVKLVPSRKPVTLSNRLSRAATPKPRPFFDAGRRLAARPRNTVGECLGV